MGTTWKSYEEVAKYLIEQNAHEFGLNRVGDKQKIPGHRSGSCYEIDAIGIREGNEGFVIIECRKYTTSKQNQEKLGGLAYRIIDTGAAGGIIVSPLGIQKGATKIAASENILEVQLNADCTPKEFVMKFLDKLKIGVRGGIVFSDTPLIEVFRKCQTCGNTFPVVENEIICPDCQAKSASK